MSMDVLDFPPIEAPPPVAAPVPAPVAAPAPASVAAVPMSIKQAVLAQFRAAETAIVALAAKYRDVAYDVTTTKGMNEAKAARLELREKGRFALQRTEKAVKADVNDLKRVMADEVDRLVKIVQPVEDAIHAQITAEEERKAREKAERERAEAERVAGHRERLAKIAGYLTHCQQPGMTAARIQTGIDMLAAAAVGGPDWQEFAAEAVELQRTTLDAMRALHAAAVEREAEAARLEAQRQEQARVAAEQARIAAELAAKQEAVRAEAERLERERREMLEQQQRAEAQRQEEARAAAALAEQAAPSLRNFRSEEAAPAVQAVQEPEEFEQQPGAVTPVAQGGVAGNPVQPQPVEASLSGDAAADDQAGADQVAACAPAASVTLTEHQLLLAEACDLLEQWLLTPPTKKQAVECFAAITSLRDRGGIRGG